MGATVLQPPVATDILPASRGRSGKSSRTWASRSSHHPSRRPGAHQPTGASSCRSMTIATSFKRRIDFSARDRYPQRLSGPGRKPPKPPGTANWDAVCADARKPPPHGGARRCGEPTPDCRHAHSRSSRVVRQLEDRCRSAIDRSILHAAVDAARCGVVGVASVLVKPLIRHRAGGFAGGGAARPPARRRP